MLRRALIEKGLLPGLEGGWWVTRDNNWNQVCLGGLTLGALAIAEDGRSVRLAQDGKVFALSLHTPAGARFTEAPVRPDREVENANHGFRMVVIDIPPPCLRRWSSR